jgi:hypothetical protein
MFKEICTLVADLTPFVIGADLQCGHYAQDAPARCVLLSEGGGGTEFDCPDMADLAIQAISRAETYHEARADAMTVFRALHGTSGWNLPRIDGVGPDYLVMDVEALNPPQYLDEDDNRRHLFSVNFIFRMEEGSCAEPTP